MTTPKASDNSSKPTLLESTRNRLSQNKELLAIFVNIGTAFVALYLGPKGKVKNVNFPMIIEIVNIATLLIALWMLSLNYNLEIKTIAGSDEPESQMDRWVKMEAPLHPAGMDRHDLVTEVTTRVARINKVVRQLISAHKGFAIFLVFLYALLFINDSKIKQEVDSQEKYKTELNDSIKKNVAYPFKSEYFFVDHRLKDDSEILSGLLIRPDTGLRKSDTTLRKPDSIFHSALYAYRQKYTADSVEWRKSYSHRIDSLEARRKGEKAMLDSTGSLVSLILDKQKDNEKIVDKLLVIILDNLFNILSAAFLFVGFTVLYYETVEPDNITNKINYLMIFSIAGGIFLVTLMILTMGVKGMSIQTLILVSRILSGLFNGVGMALLFSRFISIEYFYRNNTQWARYYYSIGTVVILPIYAVIQPLWGFFETDYAGDQIIIETIVLLITLWGKIFFFLMIYGMLKNRWLHAYLYTLRFSERTIGGLGI